jgi:cytochrome c-type biogenesis protein
VSLSLIVMRVLADQALAGVSVPVGVPLGLAFGAGVLSTLNPCGFALLPAYVSYAVEQQVETASDRQPSGWQHLLRGGLLGLPLAAGFLLVHLFPWFAILVGTGLVFLGGWTLFTGRAPEIPGLGAVATKLGRATPETQAEASPRALRAAWIFGVGYGLSSLGCTLPVFLLVVGTTITAGGVGSAALVLASYAAGMTLVLLAVALAATQLGDLLRSAVFPLLRWVMPLASLFLIVAGLYIVVYQLRAGLW